VKQKIYKKQSKAKQRNVSKQSTKARYRRNAFMNESQEAAKKNKNEQEQGHQKGEINGGDSIPSHPIPFMLFLLFVYYYYYYYLLLLLLFCYSTHNIYIQIENLDIDINKK
jgi:hypothetical protein